MPDRHFILGTAGHIDHGKSSLVKALTGTDPDRLPEEKARGMTIELGFANLSLPASDDSGDELIVGVVDVPGHSDFVKNMVAGVGSIDLALFVVAADDGWMPQTEEHYQILNYLGVRNAIVALTKADLIEDPDDLELVLEDIRENIGEGDWKDIEVVPTSSETGSGIDELRAKISQMLTESSPVRNCGKPRLPVDRAFSIKGVGTVVTGTLIDGEIAAGDDLIVQPGGLKAHIRNVQSHQANQDTAAPGTRTALNMTGISLAARGVEGIARGNVLTDPALGEATRTLDIRIEKCDREVRGQKKSLRPVRTGREVLFHYGSASYPARLHLLGTRVLEPGQTAIAELRFKDPVYVFVGDRFVLRDASAGVTLAGGLVLDEDANRRMFRKPWQADFLKARAENPDDLEVLITSQVVRDKAAPAAALLARSRFSREEIAEKAAELVDRGVLAQSGSWLFDQDWWKRVSGTAAEMIAAFHKAEPDQVGLPLRDLKAKVEGELPTSDLFGVLMEGLLAGEFIKAGPIIRRRDHTPRLPPELTAAAERIRKLLAEDPIAPPNKGEVAIDATDEKALRFLIQIGEVVELNPKTVITAGGYDQIKSKIVEFLHANGRATASDLRKVTETSRRILLPILERFDALGVTARDGDFRSLK
ncbi:MAG: selenocysteine-specific elongation factor [Verrucomicrobiales bacterium]|jgi:selenocysteine-specific elongation factor